MRVIRLQAENFKRLTAVDITPKGDVVTITGKNAQGKSSVLDALWAALEGAAALPSEAVRQGAERALIRVDLGKYIVTRTISRKAAGGQTTAVKVENADGAVFPSPQKLLDDLIGRLTFDPLEFARMKPKDQFDALAKFVPGIDFEAIANLNRGAFDKRTDVNRRAREARALAGAVIVPAQIPDKVNDVALVNELSGATARESEIAEHGRVLQRLTSNVDGHRNALQQHRATLEELAQRVASIKEAIENDLAALRDAERALDAAPSPPPRIDTQAVAIKLGEAQTHNRAVDDILRNVEKKASLTRLAEALEKESDELTAAIEARLAAKAKAVSDAKMPVDGIGFGDNEILLNGVPFAQGSSAEQLRTSVAIAATMNPTLRVIHIRDGSLLDVDSMAWLAEYAKANDLQVWCEVVGTDEKVGVLIEDGHVKAAEAAA